MGDRELACVDKFGCPLAEGEQVVQNCTIPGHSRSTIRCRVDGSHTSRLGVVESMHAGIQLARSLNRLTGRGEILVQCVNSIPGDGKTTIWVRTGPLPFCPGGRHRAVVGSYDGRSSTEPVSKAEDRPITCLVQLLGVWRCRGWLRRQRRAPGHGQVAA